MDGKTIGWIILGVGVLALGALGVKVIIDRKNDEEMLRELEEEYQQKQNQKKLEEAKIYELVAAQQDNLDKDNTTEDDDIDLGNELDLRIDDEDDTPAEINTKAEKAAINFSQTLQEALCAKLGITI